MSLKEAVPGILLQENIPIIQGVLDLGLCLVPSNISNKNNNPKVPWWDWKKITEPLSAVKLRDAIYASGADCVACVGGKISGVNVSENPERKNGIVWLVIIDIDSKFKQGIDAEIFAEI